MLKQRRFLVAGTPVRISCFLGVDMKKILVALGVAAFIGGGIVEAMAAPPPWAPAHGYRAKHAHGHKHKKRHKGHSGGQYQVAAPYVPPFGIDLGRCNRDALGAVLGGAAGVAIGSQIGSGSGNVAATIGGGLIGAVIGGVVGQHMDNLDQNCVGQILEHAQDGQTITWNNDRDGQRYQVMPTKTFDQGDGRFCREYISRAVINGQQQQTFGRACRDADGRWRLVS